MLVIQLCSFPWCLPCLLLLAVYHSVSAKALLRWHMWALHCQHLLVRFSLSHLGMLFTSYRCLAVMVSAWWLICSWNYQLLHFGHMLWRSLELQSAGHLKITLREIRGKLPAARNCAGDSLSPFQEKRTSSQHLPGHMANNCASAYYFCIAHHEPFKREEIEQLWQCGLVGTSNPQACLNAVFFYNGFQFCLRGEEHRRLKLQQIKRDDMGYIYYENGSKNCKGVPVKKNIANKVVRSDAVPENGSCASFGCLPRQAAKGCTQGGSFLLLITA